MPPISEPPINRRFRFPSLASIGSAGFLTTNSIRKLPCIDKQEKSCPSQRRHQFPFRSDRTLLHRRRTCAKIIRSLRSPAPAAPAPLFLLRPPTHLLRLALRKTPARPITPATCRRSHPRHCLRRQFATTAGGPAALSKLSDPYNQLPPCGCPCCCCSNRARSASQCFYSAHCRWASLSLFVGCSRCVAAARGWGRKRGAAASPPLHCGRAHRRKRFAQNVYCNLDCKPI